MVHSRRHRHHVACNADGAVGMGVGTVAELAVSVIPHDPKRAIPLDEQGMAITHRSRHHVGCHSDRQVRAAVGSVAELTKGVGPHAP